MFFRDTISICVVLHFSQSFYKCVDCALVIKPQNVAVLSGESVTLHCASGRNSKGNIAWNTINPVTSLSELIFNENILSPSVSSYIYVLDRDDGNCSLHINATVPAAKRYVCIDRETGDEASAELIVIESIRCKSSAVDKKNSVVVSCAITSAGNWAPIAMCREFEKDGENALKGNLNESLTDNQLVKRIWKFSGKNTSRNIECWAKFEQSDMPKGTSAANIPENISRTYAYTAPESEKSCWNEVVTTAFITVSLILLVELLMMSVRWVYKRKKSMDWSRAETQNMCRRPHSDLDGL